MNAHRWVLALGLVVASVPGCGPEPHAHAHGEGGHGDHAHPHSEGAASEPEPPDQDATLTGRASELFVQFPALVKGRAWPFAVHLTRLEDYRAVAAGSVTVRLSGAGAPEERFVKEGPDRPGYFRTLVEPKATGLRQLTIEVDSPGLREVHDLGPYMVHASVAEAIAAGTAAEAGAGTEVDEADEIPFLKEQQWKLDFRLDPVGRRSLRPSLRAFGVILPRHHGEAWIVPPQRGRLLAPGGHLPDVGERVERDQVMGLVAVPLAESVGDPAGLDLAVERARLELSVAEAELQRAETLLRQEAVPERRVLEAKSRKAAAEAEVGAAERRRSAFREMQKSEGEGAAGRIELRTPLAGTVVSCQAVAGVFVDQGERLFRVVDLEHLWLEARVPAARIAEIGEASGAWFQLEGSSRVFEVDGTGGGHLVRIGNEVDPGTRTLAVVYEVPNTEGVLRLGMHASVRILTGNARECLAVPRSAVVDEAGRPVAYVQVAGETFARRPLTLGLEDEDWIEVREGLEPGDRVVTRGAYYLRLAAAAGSVPSHGHAH